ncbi:MAG TPA: glycosyltransferase family 4 protein [Candidatus Udaeobacter sp.]|jgi:glycosyltransferase involved in cell wall biosynthesis|nr:glycosyltransferase family 4 protein [Candidatus Udaeobacter sp.]
MASPGRVLHLSENLPLPFDRRVWMELSALRAGGYEVSAICPMGEGWSRRHEVIDGIHVWRYPPPPPTHGTLSYVWEFLYCWLQTAWLSLVVLFRRGFDVVHAANPPDTFWAIALPYKLFGKKYVFDHHDLCPELYVARFGERRTGNLLHRLLRGLEWAQFRVADLVISTNESYRGVAIGRGHVPEDRVVVVRSGPSRERFATVRPVDAALRRGRPFLCAYLGVMAPQDGVDHLLRAAAELIHRRGRSDVSFTLVGSGDSFADLRRLAVTLELEPFVEFTGRIPDADVERVLATADVCVCPDPYNALNDVSTMNKILEYMACGRPIVAYDLREHRASAAEGALYAVPNREDDLAAKIEELLDDPKRRECMGIYNRQRFLERMAWEYSAGELIRAYRKLCEPKPSV